MEGDHGAELDRAWDRTKDALETLLFRLRSVRGYDGMKLELCLRNKSRCEIYKVSDGTRLSERSKAGGIVKRKGHLRSSRQNVEILYRLNTKEFRAFFTSVRMSLRLKFFDWPRSARCRFKDVSDEPPPSGPGRANSGRDNLILMLRLSCESDEKWDGCVQKELVSLLKRNCTDESGTSHTRPTESIPDNAVDIEPRHGAGSKGEASDDDEIIHVGVNNNSGVYPCNESMLDIMELVKKLPSDTNVVSVPKREWVSMPSLMSLIRYPRVPVNCEWYVQKTPADGNCLFSAIMTAANVRGMLPVSLRSVSSIRETLKMYLRQLSNAGSKTSIFRREWLASCIHEIDDRTLAMFLSNARRKCEESGREEDVEYFLKPLRLFVWNWANMVGGAHWGGLLRVEIAVLAALTGSVIEVLQTIKEGGVDNAASEDEFLVCDARCGGSVLKCRRTDLVYPISSHLPNAHNGFFGHIGESEVRGGWIGPYPVLRVVLENRHYSVCTSKHGYPIAPPSAEPSDRPWSTWFNSTDTLVESYSKLSTEEETYYERAVTMIEDWREALALAPCDADHANALVMHCRDTELSVSMLSHLEISNTIQGTDSRYMLGDELITCYMHLLETRANGLSRTGMISRSGAPPRCRYMGSWYFKAISRGASGPSAERVLPGISSLSMIVLPALVNGHWLLAVCYLEHFIVGVYDSFQEKREDVFRAVKPWIERQKPPPCGVEWRFMELRESRGCSQKGVLDCGVYTCKAAESYGLGIPFRMSQWDVPYIRKRMMVELVRQEAVSIRWPRK